MKAIFTLFLFTFILSSQAQVIRYVRVGGTGDGSAWQFATGNLQNAINASAPGDEVWVAAGEYKPTSPITDPLNLGGALVNRYSTFTMKSGVKVYGSFPATGSPTMNDRNYVTHASTLSGDIGVVDNVSDNCFHVCFFPNTSNTVLDGFTVKGGYANGNTNTNNHLTNVSYLAVEVPNYQGSGAYIIEGSNLFKNCTFWENQSIREGGAVYISNGNHEFVDNIFTNNRGRTGGGALFCSGGEQTFTGNLFVQNLVELGSQYPFPMISAPSSTYGGAVYSTNANLILDDNTFESNLAQVPNTSSNALGGALYIGGGTHTIQNCRFNNNSATFLPSGVQVCLGGAIYFSLANSTVSKCEFNGNLSHGAGGAIIFLQGTHVVNANRFSANESVGNGGAFSALGTNLTATNNIYDKNTALGGGAAIHCQGSSPSNHFVNNTFYQNTSSNANGAAGIYMDGGIHHILNSIFYDNKINNSTTVPGADVRFYNATGSTFLYNLFQTGSSDASDGNIGFDGNNNPLFVDAENGNFALLPLSPCINAGNNDFYLSAYEIIDFLGNTRIDEDTIDMGAIENQAEIEPISISEFQTPVDLRVFPNPVQMGEWLTVEAVGYQSFIIVDLYGKQIFSGKLNEGSNALNIDQLVPGFYMLQTETNTIPFIKN